MYLADVFTVAANLAGLPAISMPCGMTKRGLPVGLQLTARPFDEATLLRARPTRSKRRIVYATAGRRARSNEQPDDQRRANSNGSSGTAKASAEHERQRQTDEREDRPDDEHHQRHDDPLQQEQREAG